MPLKPFIHFARVGLAKGISHAYAPSVVVAGQLHNYPASKLTKAQQFSNAFTGSGSSGAGAGGKAGHTTQSAGSDGGLGQYYAAWQHAQQTGDDTDWKQHQTARKIGWKNADKTSTTSKKPQRLDSIKAADILRPSPNSLRSRSHSDVHVHNVQSADHSFTEAEALARVDEAIALEIKNVQESHAVEQEERAVVNASTSLDETTKTASEADQSINTEYTRSPSTNLTSPEVDATLTLSNAIVELGLQQRWTEIPQRFEAMIKDGLVPTIDAYNQILMSAICLSNGYQPYPRALEVYGDMAGRSVAANQETYRILISFLTHQSLEVIEIQKDLAQQRLRYGTENDSFALPSLQRQQELYTGDTSLQFASKFYSIAAGTVADFTLSKTQFNRLLKAYAQSGSAQNMRRLLTDMKEVGAPVALELYTVVIDACASVKDIETAKECYRDYRDRAIGRTLDPLDVKVYVSLIRAYYSCGEAEEGRRFYEKVVESFEGSAEKDILTSQITDAYVVDGLVQHQLDLGHFDKALSSLELYPLTKSASVRALNKIGVAAADGNNVEVAEVISARLDDLEVQPERAIALSAMHFRAGQVEDGIKTWAKTQQFSQAPAATVNFATMYALSLIRAGKVEEGLAHARAMFRQIRSASLTGSAPQSINRKLDEVVLVVGQEMSGQQIVYSAQSSVLLFRLMIENGGLVPLITRDAIARLGPDCIHQLSPQDIALALHVQAYMLPQQSPISIDAAQTARFSHLLETVLDRGILMDPSTLHAVSDALPRLGGARPDLEQRWHEFMQPPSERTAPQVVSPILAQTPVIDQVSTLTSYDPYANTTDHRASRVISDLLESTSGRIEGHISDAMSRLRNVRRMGRHLQYGAYAKLITASGKAKNGALMREILGMAQTDVPFNAQIPSVKAGWVSIYDSMIAACLTVGNRQMAAKYHQDLLAMGAAPSANTFGIYITTLEGTSDEATEAVKIFQQALSEGVTPSVFLFNAVIGKLGKARRIDDCLHYFGQMQNLGIRPSSVTYGTLVNALCRTSEESFAVDMFDEMEAAPNYRPRPAPYNSIIQYFLNTRRDRSKVLQYYGRMRSKNIKPTSHTYKLLIEAYATLEPINLTAAETVLEDMKANGIQPEAVHYGSLIHARGCVLGDMAGARSVFDSVLADSGIRATDNLYQNLLESMVANHQVDQSEEILADMNARGIAMTPYIANTLIHGWAGKNNIEKAKSIYDKLGNEHREPSTYEAMTRAFLTVGDRMGAQSVVTEMLAKGYPNAVSEKILALVGGNVA